MLVSGHLEEKQQQRGEPHGSRAQEAFQTGPDIRRGKRHHSGRSERLESARQQVPQPISRLSSCHSIEFRRRIRRRRIDLSVLLIPDVALSRDGHVCTSVSLLSPFFHLWKSFSPILILSALVFFFLHLRRIYYSHPTLWFLVSNCPLHRPSCSSMRPLRVNTSVELILGQSQPSPVCIMVPMNVLNSLLLVCVCNPAP